MLRRALFLLAVFVVSLLPATAQIHQHDPLTPEETDELRQTAQEANARLKLLVEFARLRIAALDKPLTGTTPKDRGIELHDRLENFALIYDELEDNITQYLDRKEDFRKALRLIIVADEEFAGRLRRLREAAADPNASADAKAEAREYSFVLSNATDALATGLPDHRKLLQDQEEAFNTRKRRK